MKKLLLLALLAPQLFALNQTIRGNLTVTGNVSVNGSQTFTGATVFSGNITAPSFTSSTANPASAGTGRLANTNTISWRNAANSGNVSVQVDANNFFNTNASGFAVGTTTAANQFGIFMASVNTGSIAISGNATLPSTDGGGAVFYGSTHVTKPDLVEILTNGVVVATFTRASPSGNLVMGTAALATTATDGFIYLASSAGTPTGVPTAFTGRVPMIYDTTNNKACFYNGGSWHCTGAL